MSEITLDVLAQMVANGFAQMEATWNENFSRIETRLDRIEGRLDRIETRLDRLEEDVRYLRQEMALVRAQLDRLEERVNSHDGYAKEIDALRERVQKLEAAMVMK